MKKAARDISQELESWYSRKNGQYLLDSIRQHLENTLATAFGYHILQLGVTRQHPLYENSPINHRIYTSQKEGDAIGLVARCDELPLESDSIDILIAHHSLEFVANPHQSLREMQRVLAPQGHLMIIGFNPYSATGAAAYLKGLSRKSPWQAHHAVGRHRLTDWLHLLGCEVQDCSYLYAVPPRGVGKLRDLMVGCDRWLTRHNVPVGGLYVLHAVKQVTGLNRPRSRLLATRERLIGLRVTKPGTATSPVPSVHSRSPAVKQPGKGDVAA